MTTWNMSGRTCSRSIRGTVGSCQEKGKSLQYKIHVTTPTNTPSPPCVIYNWPSCKLRSAFHKWLTYKINCKINILRNCLTILLLIYNPTIRNTQMTAINNWFQYMAYQKIIFYV